MRQQVEEIIGQGQQAPSGHIPFTPRAKKVLELSLRESEQLGHDYIGTEHILLGLIREGDGVAAQVLVKLGADLNRVRQQVIDAARTPDGGGRVDRICPQELGVPPAVQARLEAVEQRLAAIEQRLGPGRTPVTWTSRSSRSAASGTTPLMPRSYEHAASLRDREKELLASKAARQEQWTAGHPALPVLAERCEQLADEIERLRALLRQHGIDPQDKPA